MTPSQLVLVDFLFKCCFAIVLLLFNVAMTIGQQFDTRALIDITYTAREINIAPDGSTWVVTEIGDVYVLTENDSIWHVRSVAAADAHSESYRSSSFDRVSFFDADTAIATGYLWSGPTLRRHDAYYRTTNAGKSWVQKTFDGDSWIYVVNSTPQGHAWMGTASRRLYFSRDYGRSWTNILMPYTSSDRTICLDMIDSLRGIAGSEQDELFCTSDNWHTTTPISTPLQQNRHGHDSSSIFPPDSRIMKVRFWK